MRSTGLLAGASKKLLMSANVLFPAAYRKDAGVRVRWNLRGVELVTSEYAVEEARRNLAALSQQQALDELLETIDVVDHQLRNTIPTAGANLPEKDQLILGPAVYVAQRPR